MNSYQSTDTLDVDLASKHLVSFVYEQANRRRREVGIDWRPSRHAPETFADLKAEYACCSDAHLPLRVSNLYCDNTILGDPRANYALRFWHDTNHVLMERGFDADGETDVACFQLEALRAAGFSHRSLEHRLLHADSLGQNLCLAMIGRYPTNQMRFALWCLSDGVDEAIAYEYASGGEAA